MFQAFGWYDCADGKRNKALSTCFSLTPVYPRDKTEMHRGSIYLEDSHIDFSQFINLSIYLEDSRIDFSPHFKMYLLDFSSQPPLTLQCCYKELLQKWAMILRTVFQIRTGKVALLPFWEIF